MYARLRMIELMKLVVASNLFIRIPFMLEGVFQGLIGSGFAIGVVFGVQRVFDNIAANQDFSLFSGLVVDNQQVMTTSVFVMITGVLIGALGSAFEVSRFIRSEERRVGKYWVSPCRSRWFPYHQKKNDKEN